tara:strand:- start:2620 stop:2949 length:330 start_codon:yes stop_codon:yes gene_type:complete
MEISEYSDYIILGVGTVLAGISWMLKKEHNRIAELEGEVDAVGDRLSEAVHDIGKNDVADREWRKRVEENHRSLLKADEDRRGDARKIYDKIENTQKEIQRLAEIIAGK